MVYRQKALSARQWAHEESDALKSLFTAVISHAMTQSPPGDIARALVRRARWGALATALTAPDEPILAGLGPSGWPMSSAVALTCTHDASPLMLLSNLALHSRNIAADSRISVMVSSDQPATDPLSNARLTLFGRAQQTEAPDARSRFLRHHPEAEAYVGFSDFKMYRMDVEAAHWIGGFGDIGQIAAPDILFPAKDFEALASAEERIIDHMNADHADAIALFATRALGLSDDGWRMSGCDPEGIDLTSSDKFARLEFDNPVTDAEAARNTLVALTQKLQNEPS